MAAYWTKIDQYGKPGGVLIGRDDGKRVIIEYGEEIPSSILKQMGQNREKYEALGWINDQPVHPSETVKAEAAKRARENEKRQFAEEKKAAEKADKQKPAEGKKADEQAKE